MARLISKVEDYTARVMADTSIPEAALTTFLDALDKANVRVAEQFPGDSPARQPVHTVYGGAHLFKADAAQKLGALALRALQEHAPDAATLAARARPRSARSPIASTCASSTS